MARMTNKEAIEALKWQVEYAKEIGEHHIDGVYVEALDLAVKALEIVDDVNHKIYRNEHCDRAGKCIDYIDYHCAGCNGAKETGNNGC